MSHRIGKINSNSKRRDNCREIFNNKKRLKGTSVSITESLTAERMRQLKIARDQFGFKDVRSIHGRITYRDSTSTKYC